MAKCWQSAGKVMAKCWQSDGKCWQSAGSCQHFKKCAGISPILNRYQRFYMQNEAMNHCFHSSIKDLTNMTVIIGKCSGFKTENFWTGIVDLCSKMSQMRGIGWSDEKNISDLGPAWTISIRSVFLAQSHQISGAELEN